MPLTAVAGRVVRAYEVDVEGEGAPAVQGAMRQALVRATGRRESADDPGLAGVVAEAPRYVKGYAIGPHGESQVVFDAAAVESAIRAAGRSIWERERPFTLVVLMPPRSRAAEDAARAELERVAAERGLPISLLPLAVVDAGGNPLAAPAVLDAAQRYGGDEVLVGRGDPSAPEGELQWTLYTRSASESWSGPLASGIDHTVDLLAPQQGGSPAQADAVTRVRIDGVAGLADYAAVARLLESTPGVRRTNIAAAEADSVVFEVTVRGGATGLAEALAGSTRLARTSAAGAPPAYRYQPRG
ncbi:MAG TPA: DUF2066 domain-containing protein [Steroidobacteraceae bacterium]|nr:DUF2066 domain-containing protein [Steroidobacteraceae bacterium]